MLVEIAGAPTGVILLGKYRGSLVQIVHSRMFFLKQKFYIELRGVGLEYFNAGDMASSASVSAKIDQISFKIQVEDGKSMHFVIQPLNDTLEVWTAAIKRQTKLMQGSYLWKGSKTLGVMAWHQRWFQIKNHAVHCYKKHESCLEPSKDFIDLKNAGCHPHSDDGQSIALHQLNPDGSSAMKWIIKANNSEIMDKWLKKIMSILLPPKIPAVVLPPLSEQLQHQQLQLQQQEQSAAGVEDSMLSSVKVVSITQGTITDVSGPIAVPQPPQPPPPVATKDESIMTAYSVKKKTESNHPLNVFADNSHHETILKDIASDAAGLVQVIDGARQAISNILNAQPISRPVAQGIQQPAVVEQYWFSRQNNGNTNNNNNDDNSNNKQEEQEEQEQEDFSMSTEEVDVGSVEGELSSQYHGDMDEQDESVVDVYDDDEHISEIDIGDDGHGIFGEPTPVIEVDPDVSTSPQVEMSKAPSNVISSAASSSLSFATTRQKDDMPRDTDVSANTTPQMKRWEVPSSSPPFIPKQALFRPNNNTDILARAAAIRTRRDEELYSSTSDATLTTRPTGPKGRRPPTNRIHV